ncbi:MAG: diaminopimelate epimerase [Candidatus Kapabacteria bacterium]|nr:diaminopimelate epimerase [Candidatus Kapabacteria bacterium]MDW8011820.1 diaminopimelate epimerase [Bacteroidota bacterium]
MLISVTYVSGAGNTFTLVRERRRRLPLPVWRRLARQLCQWTDGLLLVGQPDANGRIPVHYFNPDGSTGMLCGNGACCAAAVAMDQQRPSVQLLFAGQEIEATATDKGIRLRLGPPPVPPRALSVELPERTLHLWFVDTGSPHAVLPLSELTATSAGESLESVDMEALGRQLRYHPRFAPAGVNVSVYAPAEGGKLRIRTYERGVERETQACGTAAIAVALTAWFRGEALPPVELIPRSRVPLVVDWEGEAAEQLRAVFLEGSVQVLGKDTVEVSLEEEE